VGFFRIWVVLSLVGFAALVIALDPTFGYGRDPIALRAQLARFGILAGAWTAVMWLIYAAIIWIASGFAAAPGLRLVPVLVMSGLCFVTVAGSWIWLGEVNRQHEEEGTEFAGAPLPDLKEVEKRTAEIEKRTAEIEKRTAEILLWYPSRSKDLEQEAAYKDPQDAFYVGGREPRPPGFYDHLRRDPETGRDYLIGCAESWIRRKCSRALATEEFSRGEPMYDTATIERARIEAQRKRKEAAERNERIEAQRKREEAAERNERIEAQRKRKEAAERNERIERLRAEGQLTPAEAESWWQTASEAERRERMMRYSEAGEQLKWWCAQNEGVVFGPKDPLRASMQRDCKGALRR
jgi:hypothetical protein